MVIFAGIMMIMAGVFQAFAGLTALLEDEFFVATGNYVFKFDVTTWGWVHLLGGVVVALAGVSVMSGRTWARVIGIILAVLSALANFTFIPFYPVWSLLDHRAGRIRDLGTGHLPPGHSAVVQGA